MLRIRALLLAGTFIISAYFTIFAKEITVISFGDFHGSIQKTTSADGVVPGIKKFISAVEKEKQNCNNNTILVSAGDNYQGTFISSVTHGAPVNDMFKLLHVAASVVGNHEFDWGTEFFNKWSKDADMDYLVANLVYTKNNKPVSWAKPYMIVKKDGLKIAFIGLATRETLYTTLQSHLKGLKFLNAPDAAQKWIDFLNAGKAKEGKPDAIIALTHIPSRQAKNGEITGTEIQNLCDNTKGLDAVISAHYHKVVCGYINHIPVIQAGSHGEYLGKLSLYFNDKNKLIKIKPSIIDIANELDSLPDSKSGTEILEKYSRQLTKYYKVIGLAKAAFIRDGKTISNPGYFVAKVIAQSAGTQIGIMNTFGLRADIKAGKISTQDIYSMSPFNNKIYALKMKGKDLRQIVENSIGPDNVIKGQYYGIKIFVDSDAPAGHKVVKLELPDGTPLDMNKYYSIAVPDFIYKGGDKFDFSKSIDLKKTGLTVRDSIINYIIKHKEIAPENKNNLIDTANILTTIEFSKVNCYALVQIFEVVLPNINTLGYKLKLNKAA